MAIMKGTTNLFKKTYFNRLKSRLTLPPPPKTRNVIDYKSPSFATGYKLSFHF